MSLKDKLQDVLTGKVSIKDAVESPEEFKEIYETLQHLKKNTMVGYSTADEISGNTGNVMQSEEDDKKKKEFEKNESGLAFNDHGQWSLNKAKYEEKADPAIKRAIRRNRWTTETKEEARETKGLEAASNQDDNTEVKWRKPKSGEGHLKTTGTEEVKQAKHTLGDKGVPDKAGKAFYPTTGRGERPKKKLMQSELVKFDNNGQWSLDKAIKPGKPLDYAAMNKPQNTEANAPVLDYKKINKPKNTEAEARTLDYSNMKSPDEKAEAGKVREARSELDTKPKTALETIRGKYARAKGVKKEDWTDEVEPPQDARPDNRTGVNIDKMDSAVPMGTGLNAGGGDI